MKKIIVTSSIVLFVGLISASAFAWNGCGNYGSGNGHHRMNSDTGDYQAFYNDTTTLQSNLAADRAELNALMAGENPDSKRARVLAVQISTSEIELRKTAQKHNVSGMGMRGYGQDWNCGISGHAHNFGGCW